MNGNGDLGLPKEHLVKAATGAWLHNACYGRSAASTDEVKVEHALHRLLLEIVEYGLGGIAEQMSVQHRGHG